MGLLEQMQAVDRLVRHPGELGSGRGLPTPEDREVLGTIDARRLAAVSKCHARMVLGRWWLPRFPATLAALGGDPAVDGLARELVSSDRFERALEEDLTAAVLVPGLLDALEAGRLPGAAPWVRELLAYEYLLAVGLPRRAANEPVDPEVEARLLGTQVTHHAGGRLRFPVVAVSGWEHPVAALREGTPPDEADEAPEAVLFLIEPEGAVEAEAPASVLVALGLLAQGAADPALNQALDGGWKSLRRWLRELNLVD